MSFRKYCTGVSQPELLVFPKANGFKNLPVLKNVLRSTK